MATIQHELDDMWRRLALLETVAARASEYLAEGGPVLRAQLGAALDRAAAPAMRRDRIRAETYDHNHAPARSAPRAG